MLIKLIIDRANGLNVSRKIFEKKNVLSKSARIILLCFLHTELLGYPKIIIENKLQKKSLWIFFLY